MAYGLKKLRLALGKMMTKTTRLKKSVMKGLNLSKWYFDPLFLNTQHIEREQPALYVGNHTVYGVTDAPLLWQYLNQNGIDIRALGDKIHFSIPVWRKLLMSQGVVEGTPENCAALMQQGKSVLVFPGGAREVFKHKDEAYQLIWKQRTGFARMAIEYGYDILPFASLGGDECFDLVFDAGDVQNSKKAMQMIQKLGLMEKTRGGEMIPPIPTGIAKLPIPRPERLYFSFGEAIKTTQYSTSQEDLWAVRTQVAQSIESQLSELKKYREIDKANDWGWLRKKLTAS